MLGASTFDQAKDTIARVRGILERAVGGSIVHDPDVGRAFEQSEQADAQPRSLPRAPCLVGLNRESESDRASCARAVAKTAVWIPAFAGMTTVKGCSA
jgi:hypothetical protein